MTDQINSKVVLLMAQEIVPFARAVMSFCSMIAAKLAMIVPMGGGVGLSVHGRLRIAGDNTVFAMPETGIGYFPDVGGTYFLPRLGLEIGQWLGLTGARLNAAQSLAVGVANGFIPSGKHAVFTEALGNASLDGSDEAVQAVMAKFYEPSPMDADMPAALSAFNEKDISLNFLKTQDFYEGIPKKAPYLLIARLLMWPLQGM